MFLIQFATIEFTHPHVAAAGVDVAGQRDRSGERPLLLRATGGDPGRRSTMGTGPDARRRLPGTPLRGLQAAGRRAKLRRPQKVKTSFKNSN